MTEAPRATLSVSGDARWLLASLALAGLGEGLAIAGTAHGETTLLGAALIVWGLAMLGVRLLGKRAPRRAQRAGLAAIAAGAITPWVLGVSSLALGLPLTVPLALGAGARVAIRAELAHRLRPEHASPALTAALALPLLLGALGAATMAAPRFPSTRAAALAFLLAGLAALAATLRGGPGRAPARGLDAVMVIVLLALMAAGTTLGAR